MNLIFATHNRNKVKELRAVVPESAFQIFSLEEIDYQHKIDEIGQSFEENAWIKAETIFWIYGSDTLSEDSGLEVDALNGAPGVYSARYAGPQARPGENIRKLLANMAGIEDRRARFKAVFALIYQGEKYIFEGTVEGTIATQAQGVNGFGYDPIFIPEGYDKTFGELDERVKYSISHRTRALDKLLDFLEEVTQSDE